MDGFIPFVAVGVLVIFVVVGFILRNRKKKAIISTSTPPTSKDPLDGWDGSMISVPQFPNKVITSINTDPKK